MSTNGGEKPKIGAGHAAAMGRQGLHELRGAFYPGSNVAQQPEYGLYGTLTPGEIAHSREPSRDPEEGVHGSMIEERLRATRERSMEGGRTSPEMSLDR